MSTLASRKLHSSPHRDSMDIWPTIVELLTRVENNWAKENLHTVEGIAASIIADQAPTSTIHSIASKSAMA